MKSENGTLIKTYFHKRNDGLIQCTIRGTTPFGDEIRVDGYGKTNEIAENKARKKLKHKEKLIGPKVKEKKKKMGYLLIMFIEFLRITIADTSSYTAKQNLWRIIYFPYKDMLITDFFKTKVLLQIKHQLTDIDKLAPSTLNKIYGYIRRLADYGVKVGLVPIGSANLVKLYFTPVRDINRNTRKQLVYWTLEQFNRFISYLLSINTLWAIYFWLTGSCALRIGESRACKLKDWDPVARTLTIERQAINIMWDGKTKIKDPKTPKSKRTIPISIRLNEALKEYVRTIRLTDPEKFLFFGGITPISQSRINRAIRKYVKEANLPYMTIHGLRHSCATWLLDQKGLSPQEVAQISEFLGHDNPSMTLNTYMNIHKEKSERITGFFDTYMEKGVN